MKLYLYISDPEDFYAGEYDWCFHVASRTDLLSAEKWVFVGELDIDFSHVTRENLIAKATEQLDEEIGRTRVYYDQKLSELEGRKQKLLALEGPTDA